MNAQFAILKELLRTSESRFVSITYTNKQGETSKYLVHLNVKYKAVVAKDLKKLQGLDTTGFTEVEVQALSELIASAQNTLENDVNTAYTLKDYYEKLEEGKAVDVHDDQLSFTAYVIRRTVLVKGVYKDVKHRALTIAKDKLRKLANVKTEKFRRFILNEGQVYNVRLNGKIIEIG